MDFDTALNDFLDAVNVEGQEHYAKHYSNLEYSPAKVAGGRKYNKIIKGNSVYCFVAAADVPAKGVHKGDILFAASWKSPQINYANGKPACANIFDPASYQKHNKATVSWLYRR